MRGNDLGRRASAEPALVADATGAASGSAHSGGGQAQEASRKLFINRKELAGALAMWAVRQSPYAVPARLEDAVQAIHDELPEELDGWFWATADELREIVNSFCLNNPIIATWNVPKSGHAAQIVFSSRYDRPAADDDFIDLHALANNICRTVMRDQEDLWATH